MEVSIKDQLGNFETLIDKYYHQQKEIPYELPRNILSYFYNLKYESGKEIIPIETDLGDISQLAETLERNILKQGVINLSRNIGFIHYSIVNEEEGLDLITCPQKFDDHRNTGKWIDVVYDRDNEININYIYLRKETCYTFNVLYKKMKELIKDLTNSASDKRMNGNARLLSIYSKIFKEMKPDKVVLIYLV